jgi:hypothetical protein
VRVYADGRVKPREPLDARKRPFRGGDVPARDEDALEAGKPGASDDLVRVALEPVGIQMAVAVDEGRQERVTS